MELTHRGPRTPSIIDLGPDIWLLIFEYIRMPSDLKSLCLTCKGLRALATPQLYRVVKVCVWNKMHYQGFFRSMSAGGGLHLSNTRNLIMEEERMPRQPIWQPMMPGAETEEAKNQKIELILAIFPEDKLTTLRLISPRHIDFMSFYHVFKRQTNLAHIYGPIHIPRYDLEPQSKSFSAIRSLDLPLGLYTGGVETILSRLRECNTLKRLSLGPLSFREHGYITLALVNSIYSQARFPALRDLRLKMFKLQNILEQYSSVFDLARLTRLTLYRCKGVWQTFEKFTHQIEGTNSALQHLAIQNCDDDEWLDDRRVAENVLIALIKTLSSLHVAWENEKSVARFLAKNAHQAPNLLSLSVHTKDQLRLHTTFWETEREDFRAICEACPQIRALASCIPNDDLTDYFEVQYGREVPYFLESIELLRDLRIIHFRWYSPPVAWMERYTDEDWDEHSEESSEHWRELAIFKAKAFADSFFNYLHGKNACPKLNTVVFPSLWPGDHDWPGRNFRDDEDEEASARRLFKTYRYYIKCLQTDTWGRSSVSAVEVSQAQLRYAEPYADILDFDPEMDWFGGSPVRMNDS